MAKLVWDKTGERIYETGVNQGVLYPIQPGGEYTKGVAWNGLTAVTQSPSGAEATPLFADNMKYLNLVSAEEFGATIEAYTYPDEFALCDGSAVLQKGVTIGQQARKVFGLCYKTIVGNDVDGIDHGYKLHLIYGCQAAPSEKAYNSINDSPDKVFGLCYKTIVGNDVDGIDHGYKLHLIYGCQAAPSEKAYNSINDSPDAITFSWEITTTPIAVKGFKSTAHLEIDSTKCDAEKLTALEKILYGDETTEPRMPLPDEIATLMAPAA